MKIVTVVGARPQFIKAAAVSRTIADLNRAADGPNQPLISEIIVHTGQHYDDGMSGAFFRELDIPEPTHALGVGSGSHGSQTGRMLAALDEVLDLEMPDWVLVYGDTNSTLAGALAAAKIPIPVAHVEAGLRSFNRAMSEEVNRVLVDHVSTLLLCPSRAAVDNLAREGLRNGVHLIGDVMYQALMHAADGAGESPEVLSRVGVEPKEFLLATVHRAENTDDPNRLVGIVTALASIAENEPVLLPLHPRTRGIIERSGLIDWSSAPPGLKVIEPVGYTDMVSLIGAARLILTDSGGLQKEAYWMGVPCVTMRDETEWVETVEAGWNVIVGADPERILASVSSFETPSRREPLYGDDTATEKVVRLLLETVPG